MAESVVNPTDKVEVATEIDDIAKTDTYDSYGLVKSRWDELSLISTLWTFKRVILVSLAVYTGYICEGFEVSESNISY
jgi:SP family general alpha glucoside:H+ symporter-like MFS transporter